MSHKKTLERYIGMIQTAAAGDSLGMVVEGWKRGLIKKYAPGGKITELIDPIILLRSQGRNRSDREYGLIKAYHKNLKRGDWTDDTILLMAVGRSIVRKNGVDLQDIADEHVSEYNRIKDLYKGKSKAFGQTTQTVINRLERGISPLKSGIVGWPGNAPPLKTGVLGLYMHATEFYEQGLAQAKAISEMTHLDPRSSVAGVIQAHNIYALLNNVNHTDFVLGAIRVCKDFEGSLDTRRFRRKEKGSLFDKLEWIAHNHDVDTQTAYRKLRASSLVMESFPFALFMFQKYWDDPFTGLIETVNFGGDCDSTGAIYGALAGAKHGRVIPPSWLDIIKNTNEMEQVAKSLYKMGQKS